MTVLRAFVRERLGGLMNFGFNSNVKVGNAMCHVQTEDRGPTHPFLDTVVYMAGRVIYKRSTSYKQFALGLDENVLAEKLHERLAQQHREVIADLENGAIPIETQTKPQPDARNAAAPGGLDLRLTNPKNWFVAGNVIFEIELREKNSDQPVGDASVEALLESDKQRIPCAAAQTEAEGRATLKFPMPMNATEGSSLVIRAMDGSRSGELRFKLKAKAPKPVSQ
jgi:hypothetical protein